MSAGLDEFEGNDDIWVIVITGADDAAFCAGAYLEAAPDAARCWTTAASPV